VPRLKRRDHRAVVVRRFRPTFTLSEVIETPQSRRRCYAADFDDWDLGAGDVVHEAREAEVEALGLGSRRVGAKFIREIEPRSDRSRDGSAQCNRRA